MNGFKQLEEELFTLLSKNGYGPPMIRKSVPVGVTNVPRVLPQFPCSLRLLWKV